VSPKRGDMSPSPSRPPAFPRASATPSARLGKYSLAVWFDVYGNLAPGLAEGSPGLSFFLPFSRTENCPVKWEKPYWFAGVRIWLFAPLKYGFYLLSNVSFSSLSFHTRCWLKLNMFSFIVPFVPLRSLL